MAQVIITINYREYPISCDNGQEIQIMKLGRLLDEKAKSLTSALGHINENQLLAMVGLLLADELSELKKTVSSAPAPAASLPHAATPPAAQASSTLTPARAAKKWNRVLSDGSSLISHASVCNSASSSVK